jgi:hypothetical protein
VGCTIQDSIHGAPSDFNDVGQIASVLVRTCKMTESVPHLIGGPTSVFG